MADWSEVLLPDTPLLEIVVRGSVMYLALFTLLRVILKRESGTTGVSDLLVIVLLADAAQNGLSGGYSSVTDGVLLVAVIIGWSYLLNAVAYRWPAAARLVRPGSLVLVRDGRIMRTNMRRELITDEELHALLRKQGVTDLAEVREVRMESDGQFSVTTRTQGRSRNAGDASGGPG
ncbi:Uncharacterized membrane protein YcaP, DUF421 family [Micromonospora coriariae]|uniref:Uncharacterized membrane protein YcaP, DUF421 family n=1 Tax=Micromonospora coriariae TaxID=285665 RepID=A0A1C4VE28_9ACTN|nr:YetF domain-containing protein [Micromonospora coriariae]SCE82243.1 Uncharacterized membrane protein YcaP, DUF421 family [Micromonospora coriariae]